MFLFLTFSPGLILEDKMYTLIAEGALYYTSVADEMPGDLYSLIEIYFIEIYSLKIGDWNVYCKTARNTKLEIIFNKSMDKFKILLVKQEKSVKDQIHLALLVRTCLMTFNGFRQAMRRSSILRNVPQPRVIDLERRTKMKLKEQIFSVFLNGIAQFSLKDPSLIMYLEEFFNDEDSGRLDEGVPTKIAYVCRTKTFLSFRFIL